MSALDVARTWRALWWAALAAAPTWERRHRLIACVRHYQAATERVHAAAHEALATEAPHKWRELPEQLAHYWCLNCRGRWQLQRCASCRGTWCVDCRNGGAVPACGWSATEAAE